eukprot:TRINITY_DN50011_c0_g1_i1.p1 TRINITY_DN50011_c0_g1~~TRINITY_DN50011_c0_g1_i1.p1  ORF type:complete len:228 (-),score=18.91 TRINITY_DN50011_c0_g1_i1:95-778(-)
MDQSLGVGDILHDFALQSVKGFYNIGSAFENPKQWVFICSYVGADSPICSSELKTLAELEPEFEKRDCNIVVIGTDHVATVKKWLSEIEDENDFKFKFPCLSDINHRIVKMLGMLAPVNHKPNEMTTITGGRTNILVNPDREIVMHTTHPYCCGRNFYEVLRCIDSLQVTQKHMCSTPANWSVGEDVLIDASLTDDEARRSFPAGVSKIKPFFRITPPPISSTKEKS